ncbi:MAG: glucuronate isomerase, partial [Lactovum sp.]
MYKITEDFLLTNQYSKTLYHDYASKMPIIDFHNHLSAEVIYKNEEFKNIGQILLEGDHYKWRVLRTFGVPEEEITTHPDFEQLFYKFCEIMPKLIGNPLYHWMYLELKQYFDTDMYVNAENSKALYQHCNRIIKERNYTPRKLLDMVGVESLCTTDDPIDSLEYHKLLQDEGYQCLPTFRPDKIINMEKSDYISYMKKLESVVGFEICNAQTLVEALENRLSFFIENGCKISDHALDIVVYDDDFSDIDRIIAEKDLSQLATYKTFVLTELAKLYNKYNIAQQYHIGAARDASDSKFESLGPDTGFDYISDQ